MKSFQTFARCGERNLKFSLQCAGSSACAPEACVKQTVNRYNEDNNMLFIIHARMPFVTKLN